MLHACVVACCESFASARSRAAHTLLLAAVNASAPAGECEGWREPCDVLPLHDLVSTLRLVTSCKHRERPCDSEYRENWADDVCGHMAGLCSAQPWTCGKYKSLQGNKKHKSPSLLNAIYSGFILFFKQKPNYLHIFQLFFSKTVSLNVCCYFNNIQKDLLLSGRSWGGLGHNFHEVF